MAYHQFNADTDNAYAFGSFEVFYVTKEELKHLPDSNDMDTITDAGWYWWACIPGCMPDGEPCGPFETEQAAIDDAHSF